MFCSFKGRWAVVSPNMLVMVIRPVGRMWVGDWLRMEVEMSMGPCWENLVVWNLVIRAFSW